MTSLEETTLQLIDRARRQDAAAIGELLELHRPWREAQKLLAKQRA